MAPTAAMVARAFRCLDSDHTFSKHVSRTSPRSMLQHATCPEHHCPAIAVDGKNDAQPLTAEPPANHDA